MHWPRASQRVLILVAAALLALALTGSRAARQPIATDVPDEPFLDLRLDLNTASRDDLETLPGVGASRAARIEAYRAAHGPFTSVEALRNVPGCGGNLVAQLRPLVTVR